VTRGAGQVATIECAIVRRPIKAARGAICGTEFSKAALTRFRTIEAYRDATLAEATLFTGRTHQIRVHSAHAGHPVAGDEKYGERLFNQGMRQFGLCRLFLHAARFEFAIGDRVYTFSAPLAPDLAAVLTTLPAGTTGKNAR
jgi:23S rRNA pseudouridine955/2504/2580 synthase